MPTVSRYFIRSGIVFMVCSLVLAVAMALPPGWGKPAWLGAMTMTQLHLFVVGWITQIIFGVAIWFFPNKSRDDPRGPAWLGWTCFLSLNLGLVGRFVAESAAAQGYVEGVWPWAASAAALLQAVAALSFALLIWPRVKGRRRSRRG